MSAQLQRDAGAYDKLQDAVSEFSLITHWHLDAPIDHVWEAIFSVEDWPRWWRYVHQVEELTPGDANGLGALRRYTWSSRLPYRLTFDMRVTRTERPTSLEGIAEGDLRGTGRWHLAPEDNTTHVRYDWTVVTTKPWMNLLGPLLQPAFRWNHNQVMAEGARGLARHLGATLLSHRGSPAAG